MDVVSTISADGVSRNCEQTQRDLVTLQSVAQHKDGKI